MLAQAGTLDPSIRDNPVALGGTGWGLALSGRYDEARGILQELMTPGRYERLPAFAIAWVHVGLGERHAAMQWLERGVELRDPKIVFLRTKPFWDSLRPLPAFGNLLRRMRLI
jgi:hypothetical protein